MLILRQVVFPALRLLVWAVIAVALCVLAFGQGAGADRAEPLTPTGAADDPVVAVAPGDVASTLALTGTVTSDPVTTVRATAAGTVGRVRVAVGTAVTPGTPLLDVEQTLEPVEQPVVTAPDGTTTQAPPKPRTRTVTVVSDATGTVASLAVLADQDVAVGTDVATVSPGTLTVVAPLTQAQQFRLLTPPASASASAEGGPAPFDCGEVRTGVPGGAGSGAGSGPGSEAGAGGLVTGQVDPFTGQPVVATAQVSCRVPAGTTVFPGMSVTLTLDLGSAPGVLTVPVTAVLGTVGTGRVWVVPEGGGEPAEREVQLGLTDGTRVEVKGGVAEGEQVLEYAPAPPDDPEGDPSQEVVM